MTSLRSPAILLAPFLPLSVACGDDTEPEANTVVDVASIGIEVADGGVVLNGATNVIQTDVRTTNGILHVIDGVLLPPSN